jgi:hypothetical protein
MLFAAAQLARPGFAVLLIDASSRPFLWSQDFPFGESSARRWMCWAGQQPVREPIVKKSEGHGHRPNRKHVGAGNIRLERRSSLFEIRTDYKFTYVQELHANHA